MGPFDTEGEALEDARHRIDVGDEKADAKSWITAPYRRTSRLAGAGFVAGPRRDALESVTPRASPQAVPAPHCCPETRCMYVVSFGLGALHA
jgi:hypothetical protein